MDKSKVKSLIEQYFLSKYKSIIIITFNETENKFILEFNDSNSRLISDEDFQYIHKCFKPYYKNLCFSEGYRDISNNNNKNVFTYK